MTRPATDIEKPLPLPDGVRSRLVADVNGLNMHLLEAGSVDDPGIFLLHGFPDLAYCWRSVLKPLADAGFHVIAPDLRGYGRTTGWSDAYDADIGPFRFLNLVKDIVALMARLDMDRLHCLVGHDFGSPLAAWCALIRPDLIERLVLMSAPFPGAPQINTSADTTDDMDQALLALSPPRKHYQTYYADRGANADLLESPQGLTDFLRAYFHMKSADWPGNQPVPLPAWQAPALARLPNYYIMPADQTMPEVVAGERPDKDCVWLPDKELAVYVQEFARTGFQGGLNWYRCSRDSACRAELAVFHGRKIEPPCWYISGAADWGTYQAPGAFERMQSGACTDFRQVWLIEHAGHWVQQEQPDRTCNILLQIMQSPVNI